MSNLNTPIEWADRTWNPVVGCTPGRMADGSPAEGCRNCYARTFHDQRQFLPHKRGRNPTAPAQYHQPFKVVQLMSQRLEEPLHWRKQARVFVNSVSDLFHEDVPPAFIAQVFATMAVASNLTFMVLTKRPQRMRDLIGDEAFVKMVDLAVADIGRRHGWPCVAETDVWPLRNVWLGTSVENQMAADERIPPLLETPACVRFLSCEPLLGPVDLSRVRLSSGATCDPLVVVEGHYPNSGDVGPLHWVIAGGESGSRARPMNPDDARRLRDRCVAKGVPFFFKQVGGRTAKAGGRLLDGEVWDQFPVQ